MAQIQKGTTYTQTGTGSQVTHTNLNAHVDNSTLLAGAVIEQPITNVSNNTDTLIIVQGTNPVTATINSQTKENFTKNITSASITVAALTVGGESVNFLTVNKANSVGTFTTASGSTTVTVTQNNHGFSVGEIIWISGASLSSIIKGKFIVESVISTSQFTYTTIPSANTGDSSFNSTNGLLVSVTSTNHGLITGQTVILTTTTTGYSGTYIVTYVDANKFTYTLASTQTATSGTISWTCTNAAIQSTTNISGIVDNSNIINNGPIEVYDSVLCYNTDGLKLPSGTTVQRPKQPENGYIRYNTDNKITEVYSNGVWQNIYSYQGATSSGANGRWITLPSITKTFTGESWAASSGYITTTEQTWTITIPVGEYWNPVNNFIPQFAPAGNDLTNYGVQNDGTGTSDVRTSYTYDYEKTLGNRYIGQTGKNYTGTYTSNPSTNLGQTYYQMASNITDDVWGCEWFTDNTPTGPRYQEIQVRGLKGCFPYMPVTATTNPFYLEYNGIGDGSIPKNDNNYLNMQGYTCEIRNAWKKTSSQLATGIVGWTTTPYGFINDTYGTQGWTIYQDTSGLRKNGGGHIWVMYYVIPSQTGTDYITPYGYTNMTLTIKRPSKYLYKNAKYAIQESLSLSFSRTINI
jgi:hypothetical protein